MFESMRWLNVDGIVKVQENRQILSYSHKPTKLIFLGEFEKWVPFGLGAWEIRCMRWPLHLEIVKNID